MTQKIFNKFVSPFFFVVGLVLLYLLVKRFGFEELMNMLTKLGWPIVFILLFPIVWYALQALAWYFILEEMGDHVSFWQLLQIKLAGEAVNTITPISWMGGDPVRILMLQRSLSGTLSTASVVLDRTMQSVAVVLVVFLGLLTAWFSFSLPPEWKISFPLITLVLGLLLWFFVHRQKKGIFVSISALLTKVGIKKHLTENIQSNIQTLDKRISKFYHEDQKRFWLVLFFHLLGRLAGVIEIFMIAYLLNLPLNLAGSLILVSISILVNFIFVFIPGSLGVMEGAYGALFHLMGHEAIWGVAIQLVRRFRTIFWIFVGLVLMLHYSKYRKK